MSLDKGSIRASNVTGDVEVEGRVDNVTLDDVKGGVRLNGDFFNDIRLSKISKTVEFKSARSDITLASVPGDLEISGDSLRATDIGGPMRFVTRSKDIHLEGVTGDVEVENANGDIEIRPADKLPIGKMMLTGKHGDITVVLPANAGFQIDATTRKGDITSDFGSLQIEENNGSSRMRPERSATAHQVADQRRYRRHSDQQGIGIASSRTKRPLRLRSGLFVVGEVSKMSRVSSSMTL